MKDRPPLWLLAIVALIVALFVAWNETVGAFAASRQDMNRVASVFAMRPVTVECDTPERDLNLGDAWGYTYLTADYAVMQQELCAALATGEPLWAQAVAVLVLVHESYHMRIWDKRGDEAIVECRAIRHFKAGAALLGIDAARADELLPWALQTHWRLAARVPEYFRRDCKVPNPW